MSCTLTIVLSGRRVELHREAATELEGHLWKGSRSGAVTAAARMRDALAQLDCGRAGEVAFAQSELDAVHDALASIGPSAT
jgi:hypothetical protein